MLGYIAYRVAIAIPLLLVLSVVSFIIIQLPPGDYLTVYLNNLRLSGIQLNEDEVIRLKELYGLDKPLYMQYFIWITNFIKGNLGRSFQWNRPVNELLAERVPMTVVISVLTTIFVWIVAIPIGIYSALRQYSLFDYTFTFIGYIGLSMPGFLLALILMWFLFTRFGFSMPGLFSPEYATAPWGFAKLIDMFRHIWFPIVIIGMSGTAGLIRTMRGNLLDELRKQYVITARAKGLPERKLVFKYPVRIAINPMISTIGWMFPGIISGETLVSIVLNIQTVGPIFLRAVMSQDMYLAGSITLILSILTVVGMLVSDILLAWADPRIRYGGIEE
ncbi:MAG: ABC transporter permease [bacterium]|nr:ABC transporter permease [bacterium]